MADGFDLGTGMAGAGTGAAAGTAILPGWGTAIGAGVGFLGGGFGGGKKRKGPSSGDMMNMMLRYQRRLADFSRKTPEIAGYLERYGQLGESVFGGLGEGGQLPADVSARIAESVRAGQAARGVVTSPGAVAQEAAALAGGAEAFRSNRIGQAMSFLGGLNPFPQVGQAPSFGDLAGFEQGQAQSEANYNQFLGQSLGSSVGMLAQMRQAGFFGGAPAAPAASPFVGPPQPYAYQNPGPFMPGQGGYVPAGPQMSPFP